MLQAPAGTGFYSDTPYSDSSYSDISYSPAKVFMQVMFVTVTVPLGVTLYASCVGHFSMFTSAQLRLSVTHYLSRISPLCAHISRIFLHIFAHCLRIFGHIPNIFRTCTHYTAHIWGKVTRFSGFPRYITHSRVPSLSQQFGNKNSELLE